jgi:hypothetical protein
MRDEPSNEDRHPLRSVRRSNCKRRLAGEEVEGGIRDTAKAAGWALIGRVLSFRERTGIRSGDPYHAMLPRSSGSSTHILRAVLKMSEIRLRLVLPVDRAFRQFDRKWHLLCCLRHVGVRFETRAALLDAAGIWQLINGSTRFGPESPARLIDDKFCRPQSVIFAVLGNES